MKEKKKKKKRKKTGQDLHPWEEAVKEERFPYPGRPLHQWGEQLGQKGSFRGLEDSVTASLQQTKQRPAQRICATSCSPQPKTCACWYVQGLKLGIQMTDQEEDWGWLHGDSLKGLECGMGPMWGVHRRSPG